MTGNDAHRLARPHDWKSVNIVLQHPSQCGFDWLLLGYGDHVPCHDFLDLELARSLIDPLNSFSGHPLAKNLRSLSVENGAPWSLAEKSLSVTMPQSFPPWSTT